MALQLLYGALEKGEEAKEELNEGAKVRYAESRGAESVKVAS